MRLSKLGHACVRLVTDDGVVVIDPGMFTEPTALDGADALLITHEHADHFAPERVLAAAAANPRLRIWTNPSVADQLAGLGGRVTPVKGGDTFDVLGLDVEVHGELHAIIHPDIPRIANVGFLLDGRIFHPGDALTLPGRQVDVLMAPVYAPWSRIWEVIDYIRAVAARQTYAMHDAGLSDIGRTVVDGLLAARGPGVGSDYARLAPTDSVELT
jgi:L-ascorbate metabolism protein UlaG (beta-lactamase superfamily)